MSDSTSNSVETTVEVESKNIKKRKKTQKEPSVKKRKGTRWSKVWNDFEDVDLEEGESPEDVKAMCKHCGNKFRCHSVKHGNKNLKRHLLKCEHYKAKQSKGQTHIMHDHSDGNKMMAWKFDQKESKKALAHMVIVDELPFSFVEREGFKHYNKKGLLVPTLEDWDKARKLCGFLKIFYDITLRISGTKYVTSHMLIVELSTIRDLLRKQLFCDVLKVPPEDETLYKIAKVMKKKFDKYYGEIENMNALFYFPILLDPRNKDEFLHIIVDDHYGAEGLAMVELKKKYIHAQFKALYEDYVRIHAPTSNSSLGKQSNRDDTTTNPPQEIG